MKSYSAVSVSPISGLNVAPQYRTIEFLMHNAGAVNDVLYETGTENVLGGGIDVNGTSTNYWATRGYWTPAGDHQYVTTADAVKDFFELSSMGGDCFAAVWQMIYTKGSDLTAAESFLDVGRNASTSGWEIVFSTTRRITFGYREEGGGSVANFAQLNIAALANQRLTIGVFIDTQSTQKRVYSMYNGDESTIQAGDLPGPLPSIVPAQGINFFARGGGAGTVPLGGGASGISIGDVRYIRIPGGAVAAYDKWLEICTEMYRHPGERKLRALAS